MDVGLLQKDVASIIGTSTDCITFWENERSQPQIHFYPKIISFLGYYPFQEIDTFSGKIMKYRHLQGLSRKQMGALLGVHGTTIGSWETEKTVPNESMVRNVHICISS